MKDFLEKIQLALDEFKTPNFLVPDSHRKDMLAKACINFLENHGYFVKQKPTVLKIVKNNDQLIKYHYDLLEHRFNSIGPTRDELKDKTIAKQFVNYIIESVGVGYQQALGICANIIKVVITKHDEIGLNDRKMLASFSIYGQDKMHWVTKKAMGIINSDVEREEAELAKADKLAEEYLERHKDLDLGFANLEELAKL